MPTIVGVAFKPVTKVYYFDPGGVEELQTGEQVIVETSRGRTMGEVVLGPREVPQAEISGVLKPVVRRATAWDMVQGDQMAHKEAETLDICREKAAALRLDMKIVKAEYAFDGSSVVVYFTAEQRIDFRNLVHELAQTLRTRVEMRQVGVRDEAKFLGGLGRCGRQFCCATWLREFTPVSIKMAKQQELPLNTAEVSGVCGRLLCCLSYENDFYVEARRHMPRINSTLETPEGPGKVKQVHVLRNSVTVKVDGPNDTTQYIEVPLETPLEDLPLAAPEGEPAPAPERTAARPPRRSARARGDRRAEVPDSGKEGAKEAETTQDQESRPSRQRRPRRRRR